MRSLFRLSLLLAAPLALHAAAPSAFAQATVQTTVQVPGTDYRMAGAAISYVMLGNAGNGPGL